jgi:integrase
MHYMLNLPPWAPPETTHPHSLALSLAGDRREGDLVRGGRVRSRAIVVQQKTGRPVQFELLEPARGSIPRPEDYGTHSLRRTKASIIYKQTGNLRAVQILLGHTKIESTVRYLGVDVEDALALAEGTEV